MQPIDGSLAALGWTGRQAAQLAALERDGVVPARVVLEHTHVYQVWTEAGETLARVSGRLRHEARSRADFPAVGDWIAVEPAAGDARIVAVLPRFSRFSRRAAGNPTEEQIVAANIDTVFLVGGLDGDFNPRRIERYLIVASESGASPVVVLNKADLVEDPERHVEEIKAVAPGVPVHAVTCRRPETLEALRAYLGIGRTGALLGSSGVGKSSIVNGLIGHDLLATRDVREWDSRGRHTSTARQLVMLPGSGVLIDTPGMRELQLWDAVEDFGGTFADVEGIAAGCRFRDCRHLHEPGCAVRAAVESGGLSAGRLGSYQKLQAEQAHHARQLDQRAQIDEKQRTKRLTKAVNRHIRDKGRD